jgi:hypothetical protein
MKTLLLLTLAGAALAAPIACPLSNAPGDRVYAIPSSSFTFCLEDLDARFGDNDFNDMIGAGTINDAGTLATLTWLGADAAMNSLLFHGFDFVFANSFHPWPVSIAVAPGQEIVLGFLVGGNLWRTGGGTVNASGLPQVITWQESPATEVPEPGTGYLALAGILAVLFASGLIRLRKGQGPQ